MFHIFKIRKKKNTLMNIFTKLTIVLKKISAVREPLLCIGPDRGPTRFGRPDRYGLRILLMGLDRSSSLSSRTGPNHYVVLKRRDRTEPWTRPLRPDWEASVRSLDRSASDRAHAYLTIGLGDEVDCVRKVGGVSGIGRVNSVDGIKTVDGA